MKGKVIKSTGSWYNVLAEDGLVYPCRLRGKFKIKGLKVTNPVAVGDKVVVEMEEGEEGTGVITEIEARENYIIRKSTHKKHHGHIIATNIDQAVLVATLVYPKTSLGFIDRFLVSADSFRIPALILFNKKDLLEAEHQQYQQELIAMYSSIGYTCMELSAFDSADIEKVKAQLQDKTSLFSGHSGVGKSTLLNQIEPSLEQKTSEVSSFANKGVHTTTYAEMFGIGQETFIIDTPGIKELGLMDINEGELSHYFPEMRDLLGECKFHNCTHTHEPGCAVMDAVEEGRVAGSRYYSYLSMLENDDSHR
ncbi:ribosome small subunit-dependent GTPase A [Porifericola rhodea]|uniref:ribosome small subunit-dependent GTPase A n=1 Tax=Porifericola rhodea TaxID=930972 RepID=UPI0026663855|nr:ribosome small subunit-dependent GTPase A [Porifericola rhodea]WKN33087.1 ribosome small subunit-dependent GTPase A [Porifericola rhodea]